MLDLLNKISVTRGIQIVLFLLGNLVAPYWFLLHFKPELLNTDQIFKPIMLSVSIGLPITFICLFFVNMYFSVPKKDDRASKLELNEQNVNLSMISAASFFSAAFLYIPCAATFFIHIPFKLAVYGILAFIIFFTIDAFRDFSGRQKQLFPKHPIVQKKPDVL